MSASVLPKRLLASHHQKPPSIDVSPLAVQAASLDVAGVYRPLETRPGGLTPARRRRGSPSTARTCSLTTSVRAS